MAKKKVTKIIIASVLAVAIAGGSFFGYKAFAKSKSANSTTTFQQVSARKGNISVSVSGSGSVSDSNQITLTAANAGTVDSLAVKQGDTVKAGQTIAHIGNTNSSQTASQKQNSLTNAQNSLSQAQENLNSLYIKAPVADDMNTVKQLGGLAVISTSRSMKVSFNPQSSAGMGQKVTVTDTDTNTNYSGMVTSSNGGQYGNGQGSGSAVVTINSDNPKVGDSAVIKANGKTVGSGDFELTKYISLSNSGSGTISNVYVKENQMVSKGQNLFKLNGDSVQNDINAKEKAVKSAEDDLNNAKENAAKDTVTSPVDGVVAELDVKKGDSVTSGGTAAVIIDPNSMQTVVSVDELDISKVQVGQKANVTLDAISDKTFSGTVSEIDPIGTSSNGIATYNVTVSIDDPEGIKVGMTTNAEIITKSKQNTIVISAGAVLEKNGSTGYVLDSSKLFDSNGKSVTLSDVTTRQLVREYGKQVTIGISNQNQVEIVSGLSEGDSIAVPITINKSAVNSLTSNSNSSSSFGSFGGMGGYSRQLSGNGSSSYRKSSGTGNTVGGGSNNSSNSESNNSNSSTGSSGSGKNYSGNSGSGGSDSDGSGFGFGSGTGTGSGSD